MVAAGQTTASYAFMWSGQLPPDHMYPEPGGVVVQSPNAISSPLLGPSGTCSFRLIYRFLGDYHEACDVLQQVFLLSAEFDRLFQAVRTSRR